LSGVDASLSINCMLVRTIIRFLNRFTYAESPTKIACDSLLRRAERTYQNPGALLGGRDLPARKAHDESTSLQVR
jgi:hypothetical protein